MGVGEAIVSQASISAGSVPSTGTTSRDRQGGWRQRGRSGGPRRLTGDLSALGPTISATIWERHLLFPLGESGARRAFCRAAHPPGAAASGRLEQGGVRHAQEAPGRPRAARSRGGLPMNSPDQIRVSHGGRGRSAPSRWSPEIMAAMRADWSDVRRRVAGYLIETCRFPKVRVSNCRPRRRSRSTRRSASLPVSTVAAARLSGHAR